MAQTYEQDPRWTAVDNYTLEHLHPSSSTSPSNAALSSALKNSFDQGLPDIAVSQAQGKYLQIQAKLIQAKNILEVGTLGGVSTIWLASSRPDVKIVSVEVNELHAQVARANIKAAGYEDRVEVRVGAGVDVLPHLAEEVQQGKREKFDYVFIDADKENNWNYVDMALGMTRSGALVMVDNVVRKGAIANAEAASDSRIAGAREVVEKVGRDDRLDGVVMQTVGSKNYDGFIIAVAK